MGVSAGEAQPTKRYTKDTDDDHDRYQVYMLEDKHVMKGHGMIGFYPIINGKRKRGFLIGLIILLGNIRVSTIRALIRKV